MHILPFAPEHAARLELRASDARTVAGLGLADGPDGLLALGRSLAGRGPAFTAATKDGAIMACAGLALLWPGVAEAWALTSPLVEGHALAFHRAVRRMLPAMIRQMGLVRVQATVLAGYALGARWLERLGFARETAGPMRRYVGDDDYHLFAHYPVAHPSRALHPNPRS